MDVVVILVSIGGISGIICAIVAQGKGRDAGGWFMLGLLLGPIGIVLALVTPENRERAERQKIARGGMQRCPSCAELVRQEAAKCRYCGEALAAGATTGSTSHGSARIELGAGLVYNPRTGALEEKSPRRTD